MENKWFAYCAMAIAAMCAASARAGLEISSLGKLTSGLSINDDEDGSAAKWAKVQADLALNPSLIVAKQYAVDLGGNTSVRNEYPLTWKSQGYYQRCRDLGQVFTAESEFVLDSIILRTGNGDLAYKPGTAGAPVMIQFFEVIGTPAINNNGTAFNQTPAHGFGTGGKLGRCDDYLTGVSYKSIQIVRGGAMPDLLKDGDGKLTYLKWDLTGEDELRFEAGKRYAFIIGLESGRPDCNFTLGNQNNASLQAPENLADQHDRYAGGWSIRREGDGSLPYNTANVMRFIENADEPSSAAHLTAEQKQLLEQQSLFPSGDARYAISPTTDGYPDVDTYRDLEFYIIAKPSAR